MTLCPLCDRTITDDRNTVTIDGRTYWFDHKSCLTRFVASRYVADAS